MKRLTRPLVFFTAALSVVIGAVATAALMVPMPTDAAVAPAAGGVTIAATECQVRIAEANHGFSVTLASLSSAAEAGLSQRCDAYRAHVAALTGARSVYAACLSGFARKDQLAQIDLATRNWRSAIALNCAE